MPPPRTIGAFVARWILGLAFFMAGWWKVFSLGPIEHARSMFVVPYADTFLPAWALWSTGVEIPFIELLAGAMLLLGWQRRLAVIALGAVLIVVTFGHLLIEPFYALNTDVLPRALLLIALVVLDEDDRLSLDHFLRNRSVAEPPS